MTRPWASAPGCRCHAVARPRSPAAARPGRGRRACGATNARSGWPRWPYSVGRRGGGSEPARARRGQCARRPGLDARVGKPASAWLQAGGGAGAGRGQGGGAACGRRSHAPAPVAETHLVLGRMHVDIDAARIEFQEQHIARDNGHGTGHRDRPGGQRATTIADGAAVDEEILLVGGEREAVGRPIQPDRLHAAGPRSRRRHCAVKSAPNTWATRSIVSDSSLTGR